jgi:hypothetical protein
MAFVTKSVIVSDPKRGNYSSGQQFHIDIPASSVPLLSCDQTYMRCKFKFTGTNLPIVLNDKVGGAALIRSLTVSSIASNTVLEQIDDYNQLAYVQAHYENNESIINKKALVEGSGSAHSGPAVNLFWATNDTVGATGLYTLGDYKEVELLLPLSLSGILGQGRNPKVVPIIAMGGLRLTILLEHNINKITQAVQLRGDTKYNETVGFDASESGCSLALFTDGLGGQKDLNSATFILANATDTGLAAGAPIGVDDVAALRAAIPMYVGMEIYFFDGGDEYYTDNGATIASVAVNAGRVEITLSAPFYGAGGTDIDEGAFIALAMSTDNASVDIELSNIELVCSAVQAPAQYVSSLMSAVKSGLNYDYTTFTNYQVNVNNSITQSSQYIPLSQQRCLSILSVPEPIVSLTNRDLAGDGLRPTRPELNYVEPLDYFYLIKNLRTPLRAVDVSRLNTTYNGADPPAKFAAVHTKETEDAIEACDFVVRNLDRPDHCFIVARATARHGHSFNAQGAGETRLNIRYATNDINQIFNHFVCHRRRAVIKNNSLVVEV